MWDILTCDVTHWCAWHLHVRRDSLICVTFIWATWLLNMCDILMCDVTYWCVWHSYARRDTLICVCPSYVRRDSLICVTLRRDSLICVTFICATWLIDMCDMMQYNSFIRVAWLIRMCDVTHSYVWRDAFIRVTWLMYVCDMMRYDSFPPKDAIIALWSECQLSISDF